MATEKRLDLVEREAVKDAISFMNLHFLGNGESKSVLDSINEVPSVDAVEVVYCEGCVNHGNCLTEDIFRMARIEKPYCCVGKMDGDKNGYTNGSMLIPVFRVEQMIEHYFGRGWIPVTERLPEQGQEVIVYDGGVLKPKVFCYLFWDKNFDSWARVTHWMPLPEPPEEVRE